jgi:hypothetical protein
MYKPRKPSKTLLKRNKTVEGETIETKVQRMLKNKEPIKDGRPLIYTERKDGVIKAYNIRTDRWEVAAEAMDLVNRSRIAQRDSKPDGKTIEMKPDSKDGGPESTHGKVDNK